MPKPESQTLTITNFGGPLTRRNDGPINSGFAKFNTSWGYDPYSKPGNLTWFEQPTSILSLGEDNGPIVAMKSRTETAENYVYAVARDVAGPRLYQIKVNDNSSKTPNYDTPSVIGALVGPSDCVFEADMVFYGSTEKLFFKGDGRMGKINFDGSSPSSIAGVVSFSGNGGVTFLGTTYWGNGNNIASVDSTELLVNSSVLSPALPAGLTVRDLDITRDGNYMQITASRLSNQNQIHGANIDVSSSNAVDSYKFYWNGIDDGATGSEVFNGLALTASEVFQDKSFGFGYDQSGAGVYDGSKKKLTLSRSWSPHKNATFSVGNILGFAAPEYDSDNTRFSTSVFYYGQYDEDTPDGLYRILRQPAQVQDDVVSVPAAISTSNLLYTPRIYGYTNNVGGTAKIYYSTVEESDGAPSARVHRLWRFETVTRGVNSVVAGVYETQNQLFSKKVKVNEVRLYTEPLAANNSFTLGITNSASSVIASNTYTVGTNVTAGEDLVRWSPSLSPTYALGFRITNAGSANWTGLKLEADITAGGT